MPTPARIRSTLATIGAPPDELRELRSFHKALADVTRLRIVGRLAESPATVTELIDHVDLSQPLVSWHVRTLRSVGLIETRRSGRGVICSLSRDAFARYLRQEREFVGLSAVESRRGDDGAADNADGVAAHDARAVEAVAT